MSVGARRKSVIQTVGVVCRLILRCVCVCVFSTYINKWIFKYPVHTNLKLYTIFQHPHKTAIFKLLYIHTHTHTITASHTSSRKFLKKTTFTLSQVVRWWYVYYIPESAIDDSLHAKYNQVTNIHTAVHTVCNTSVGGVGAGVGDDGVGCLAWLHESWALVSSVAF